MKFLQASLAFVMAVSAVVMGCQQAPKEVKIAIVAPLSGGLSGWGDLLRNGVMLAVDEWNAQGGVLGKKISVVSADSQGDPAVVVRAANTVIASEKVHYMVGDVFSSLSIPLSNAANGAKAIVITPTATNSAVTVDANGSTKAYVFRACFSDQFQGRAGASFAFGNLKARKACVMFDPADVYVRGLAEAFAEAFTRRSGTVVGKESSRTLTPTSQRLWPQSRPQLPMSSTSQAASIPLVNLVTEKAKEAGIGAASLGGDFWDSPQLDLDAAEGSYFTNHYWPAEHRGRKCGPSKRHTIRNIRPRAPARTSFPVYPTMPRTCCCRQSRKQAGTTLPA